jgi:hypothetical protein
MEKLDQNRERAMATKKKPKRVILMPEFLPDSFTLEELRKAIKEVKAERQRRKKPVLNEAR